MFTPRVLALLVVIGVATPGYGKTFTRCELAKELVRQGFPRSQINDWVCLVEAETTTRTTSTLNAKSRDFGIFQIHAGLWCAEGKKPGYMCNIRCNDLLDDDITNDSTCAKLIFKKQKFEAWNGWKAKCKGKKMADVSSCL